MDNPHSKEPPMVFSIYAFSMLTSLITVAVGDMVAASKYSALTELLA